jgi:transposase
MSQQLPIPELLWGTVPADAQAALLDAWKALRDRIAALEATVRDLQARLRLNSTNSSKPPSSDPIGLKRQPPAPPSRRKRGGQPGHRKEFRALVPPEKLRSSTDGKPGACRRCGHALSGADPDPLIHQVAELPRIEPIVDEYRQHRLACLDCGETTCGTLPEGVPTVRFGPSLQATLAALAGAYRLSKRRIQQLAGDLFGLSISAGMISKLERSSAEALQAPCNELATAVHTAGVIGADETGWREDRHKAWLWAAVTALFTVFTIARNRNARVARAVLGTQDGSIAVTDRWGASDRIAADFRQICWSHLRRDFQAMIDRGGAAEPIGKELLRLSDRLFRWWHRLEAEEVDRGRSRTAMARLRPQVKTALEDGVRCECARTRGTCAEILRVEGSLWTFARLEGVPPTNKAAERACRHAVIWRRISGGTDSARGAGSWSGC